MCTPQLIKCYKSAKNFAKNLKKDFPLLSLANKSLIDSNGFIIEHFESDDEKLNFDSMQYYSNFMGIVYLPFLRRIINSAFCNGKLSAYIFLNFLKENTWLGLDNIPKIKEKDFFRFIIMPIEAFFNELELMYIYGMPHPNFILTIDSLIFKMEGIIKFLFGLSNSIKETTKDYSAQDKSLNKILEDEKLTSVLNDYDIFFLRFLLIEKSGLNLRNKVAHSLMRIEDYNDANAYLLVLALLKLCSVQMQFD